jgi:hypothetical protein
MPWDLEFISEEDFKQHVRNTITMYGSKLEDYDVKKFNSNIIDPVKMLFDKAVYGESWREVFVSETFRQRDKANNNEIGYFHQRIFQYMDGCTVPPNGERGGWDVIVDIPGGYEVVPGNIVHKIYVEMKNKHNTMNSASAADTYTKMQRQLLEDDDCACFLVEVIAKKSQNIVWQTTVNKRKVSHVRIRRVSIDQFYSIVTGDENAFYKVCEVLPEMITTVLTEVGDVHRPNDVVYDEMQTIAEHVGRPEPDIVMALYSLGFSTYNGFKDRFE